MYRSINVDAGIWIEVALLAFLTGTHVPSSMTAMETAAVVQMMINTASSILVGGAEKYCSYDDCIQMSMCAHIHVHVHVHCMHNKSKY